MAMQRVEGINTQGKKKARMIECDEQSVRGRDEPVESQGQSIQVEQVELGLYFRYNKSHLKDLSRMYHQQIYI